MFPIWFWIGIAAIGLLVLVVGVVTASMAVMGTNLVQTKAEVTKQDGEIKKLKRENRALNNENKKLKETSETLKQIKNRVFEINRRRKSLVQWAALPTRGGDWIGRIDKYLANTPLAGEGRTFYLSAVDAGIEPRLMPAIAMIESGGGRVNANTNNFFGRRAAVGWRSWPTPEEAIQNQGRYIRGMWGQAESPYQMKGYAVPGASWMAKVSSEMRRI